jgi:hypothetical protein
MKKYLLSLCLSIACSPMLYAQQNNVLPSGTEQEIIHLSKKKWQWMADKKTDSLDLLFHDNAMFVHMGGSMSKKQELDVIKSGGIHYKQAEIQDVSVKMVGKMAILYNRIRLTAVVGGNEVVNPFIVTEVYMPENGKWVLGSLAFTRLMGQ